MRQNWIKVSVAVGLVLLPIVFWWYRTTPPREITFAIGPQFGRYTQIMENLRKRLQREHGIDVYMIQTGGSVENVRLVQEGLADFALYQSGTERFLGGSAGIFDQLDANGDDRLSLEELQKHRDDETARKAFDLILAGQHRSGRDPIPPEDLSTIALRAQLLTAKHVKSVMVEKALDVLLSHDFMQQNNLGELIDGGSEFARMNPEFPVHAGAEKVYDPDLHPLLPTEFVESWEGIRSFTVSFVIAGFFAFRWFRDRQRKQTEHRLDRYLRALLDIERRQIPLDQDSRQDDLAQLQELLDEVTHLRQEALGEISTHELNEERGAACFVDMCHELSSKINAKLTRQTFDRQFARLTDALEKSRSEPSPEDNQNEER